jgi:hypothetical protein
MLKGLVIASCVSMSLFGVGCISQTGETIGDDSEVSIEESGDQLLAGKRLSETEVAAALRAAGFSEAQIPTMVCTAKYESSFYDGATNRNNNGSMDRGLFQINSIHVGGTNGCPTSGSALFDVATNARCARAIYRMQGQNAWYGYRSHRAECDSYSVSGGGAPASRPGDTCYSSTLQSRQNEGTCVESRRDNLWYQCVNGAWRRGSSVSGPLGACTTSNPLN